MGQGRLASLAPARRAQSAPLARLGVRRGPLQAPDGERRPQVGVPQALAARGEMEARGRPKRCEVPKRGSIDRGQHPNKGGRCPRANDDAAVCIVLASLPRPLQGGGECGPFSCGRLGGNH